MQQPEVDPGNLHKIELPKQPLKCFLWNAVREFKENSERSLKMLVKSLKNIYEEANF